MRALPNSRSRTLRGANRRTGFALLTVAVLGSLVMACDPEIDAAESASYEATGKARLRDQDSRVYPDHYTPAPGVPLVENSNGVRVTYFTPVATAASVAAVLADGVVTREEFDAATARMIACMDEQGVKHSPPVYDERSHQYRFSIESTPGSQPGLTVYDECWMEFAQDVTGRWVQQNPPALP